MIKTKEKTRKITKKILIDSVDKVKDFVKQTNKFLKDTTISSGRYIVDGKSLMGLFSLDLSKPVNMSFSEDDEGLVDIFISKYFAKGANI